MKYGIVLPSQILVITLQITDDPLFDKHQYTCTVKPYKAKHSHTHPHTPTHTSQFFGGKKKVKAKAAEPLPMDPELEQKIGEIEKMSESQVDERLQAMLVSG